MNVYKLIKLAHKEITKYKPEYSPNVHEIQNKIDEILKLT
jgi:hypothetical protein